MQSLPLAAATAPTELRPARLLTHLLPVAGAVPVPVAVVGAGAVPVPVPGAGAGAGAGGGGGGGDLTGSPCSLP